MIVGEEGIENMIDGEDRMKILNGEDPKLLSFEPLGFFKCAALRAMTVLACFVVKLPMIAIVACFQDATECWRAAIHNGADSFALLIG